MTRTDYILRMGYWSDEMEAAGLGPDVFFVHVTDDSLASAVELLLDAWVDKYGYAADGDRMEPPHCDLFWDVVLPPTA